MKRIITISLLILFLAPVIGFAQNGKIVPCYTDEYMREYFEQHPDEYNLYKAHMESRIIPANNSDSRESVRIIPVVFHIIHQDGDENIAEENIQAVLKRVNEDFQKKNADLSTVRSFNTNLIADMNIEFRLAAIDPNGNCTNGITRHYSTLTVNARDNVKNIVRWDNKKYLNIWVVKSIYNSTGEGTILGYSTLPWNSLYNPTKDGIVMRADVANYSARTLTHEIGHFFGLLHPFEGGCGSDCSSTGDKVCDTPPVFEAHYDCDTTQNTCTNDSPNMPDMVENHMDYTSCRVMFTKGQKAIVDYYLSSNYRNSLISSGNLTATGVLDPQSAQCKPVAAFSTERNIYCMNTPITLTDESLGPDNMTYKWYFTGADISSSTDQNPTVTFSDPGKHDIKLVVTTSKGSDSVIKSNAILILSEYGQSMSIMESFEDGQFNEDSWHIDPLTSANIGWKRTDLATFDGSKSLYLNNFQNTNLNTEYSFILPGVDVSGIAGPVLKYQYAHALKNADSKDILRIFVSNNCGETWSLRKIVGLSKLPTVSGYYSTQFFPGSASQWKEDLLDLGTYKGSKNLLIKFVFIANGGNNIYIDKFTIENTSSLDFPVQSDEMNMYPNPAINHINITINSYYEHPAQICLYDILGNEVSNQAVHLEAGENAVHLDLSSFASLGMYIVHLKSEKFLIQKKITIIR